MSEMFDKLRAEFPRDAISWRAQSVTKDGTKAMALAYIDARDVMQRLDDVVGPDGWQCRYPHATGKTVCEIGIRVGDEWIWKADGAGDTDIEAEKGALSDAFKRAAVRWGIGRYLYDLKSPWVPCESYKRNDGKFVWTDWKADPWSFFRNPPSAPMTGRNAPAASPPATSAAGATLSDAYYTFLRVMKLSRSKAELREWFFANKDSIADTLPENESLLLVGERNTLAMKLPEHVEEAA